MDESTVESTAGVFVDLTEKMSIRVLHVDSDSGFLKVAKLCLEVQGPFKVDTASSAEEAIEKMKKKSYDVIISDYVMPGKSGLEFLKELRDSGNNIPFIIFTGKGREEVAIKALNVGADQYFNKIGGPETVYGELAHGISQVMERKRAEETLKESKNYLEMILDSIFSGVVVIDGEKHEIVDANPKALETIGAPREHVIGKVCHSFICPAEKGKCPISDLGQTVDKSERVLLRADGKRIPILKTVTTIIWRGHRYLIESIIDITERKQAEKAMQESEERFGTLMEEVPIAIFNTDLKGKITYVNRRFEEAIGYSREEIVGKNGFKIGIMSDETLRLLVKRMKEKLTGKPSRLLEGRFKRKDGEWIWAEVEGRLIKKFGVPVGFQLTARDITERKRTEEERKRFEERLSTLHTYSRALNMAESREEVYRLTLDAMQTVLGFEYADFFMIDKSMLCIVDQHGYPEPFPLELPLDGSKKGISLKAVKTGNSVLVQDVRKDIDFVEGLPGVLSELAVPIEVGQKVLGVLNVESKKLNAFDEKDQELLEILASHAATAISDLDRAKNLEAYAQEIRESQQKFERLFMNNPEAAVYVNSDFYILDANPRFRELFGYSLDEIKGKCISDLIVPEDKKEEGEMLDRESKKAYTYYETVRKRKDGTLVLVSISVAPITVEGKIIGTVGMYKDITERKRMEKKLRETSKKLEMLLETAIEGITVVDSEEKLTFVNKAFADMLGYREDELQGMSLRKFVAKETFQEVEWQTKTRVKGKTSRYEIVMYRKDGEPRIIQVSASPLWDDDGSFAGSMGICVDITERKRYEERLSALHTHSRALNMAESREEIYRLTLDAIEKTLGFEIAFFMVIDKGILCVVDNRGYPEAFTVKLPLDGTKKGVSVKVARTGRSIYVPDAEKDNDWVEFMPDIRSGLDVPVKIGRKVLGVVGVDSKKLNAFNEKDQELLEILASHAATAMSNLEYAKNLETSAREIRESQQKFERLFMNNPEASDCLDPDFHVLDINPRFTKLFGYSLDEVKGKHINDVIVPKDKIEEAKVLDKKAGEKIVSFDTVRMTKDGTLVPVSISAAPIIVGGKLIGSVGMYKDISDLKKTEKELRDTLKNLELMNEKLRVVGGLTRHDVRNKLSAITMNIYLAKSRLAMDHKALERLNEIEPIVQNVERIFDFAKTYEMIGIEELVYIDVNKTFEEAVSLFSDLKDVKIVNCCSGLTVLADSLLRQVFYNLIDNSVKYGEKISQIRVYFEKTEDAKLKLIYEDDGVGIPRKMRSDLFKEGYGKGTGYGLYMIKKICETYGWTIQETGKPGKGVQFIIIIPKIGKDGKENYRIP
jgi:PAS domain S-box-containing protein